MKREIVALGAPAGKIKVVRYGTAIPEVVSADRKHYIYFGGHFIMRGKGLPRVAGCFGTVEIKRREDPDGHLRGVRLQWPAAGEADGNWQERQWSHELAGLYSGQELANVYQRSKACIIPFTGGSARHPLTCAMVNATPVIATRAVDIPEYWEDLGIYVDGSADGTANPIWDIETGRRNLNGLGEKLRAKALAEQDYRNIAVELSRDYSRIAQESKLYQIAP